MSIENIIGGSFEPPIKNYKFNVDNNYEWIKLNIYAEHPKWFQMLLWDSNGVLRLQYLYWKRPQNIIIHKDKNKTSSAAVPGIVPKGKWTMEIFGLASNRTFGFNIKIQCGNEEIKCLEDTQLLGDKVWANYEKNMFAFNSNNYQWGEKLKEEKSWYKGDFHTHTNVSDGKLTPIELLEEAEKRKLDFFVITEHNIMHTGFPNKNNVLVIPGMEITGARGHFNALGIKNWIDWTIDSRDGGLSSEEGMNRLLIEAKKSGALCSINHPTLTPWAWGFKETLLENIHTVEIWNDPTYPDNDLKATEEALRLWNTLWNDGYNVWGIGGSDVHNLPTDRYKGSEQPSVIGDPATFVYADALSANDILTAAAIGRMYVSRSVIIDLSIEAEGHPIYLGSDLTKIIGENENKIRYTLKVGNLNTDSTLVWIENSIVKERQKIYQNEETEYSFYWKSNDYKWLRFEIRDGNGKLLAFSNPIYKGHKPHSIFNWGQLVQATGGIEFD